MHFPTATAFLVGQLAKQACANLVFAHYMVGDSTREHRTQDVDDAVAMGINGFSMNIGDPDEDFVVDTLATMMDYARDEYPGQFYIHISMDLWAAGNKSKNWVSYKDLLKRFFAHEAYERKTNDKNAPMVTTFADGGTHNDMLERWRGLFDEEMYFISDWDGTKGFFTMDKGWWAYWEDLLEGTFSWELAWPERAGKGADFPGDISKDLIVMDSMKEHKKDYMIGLSSLQYKNAYDTNMYREGSLNMPQRMESILRHSKDIKYVDILTWNDGPESHYVGNLWPEQNTNTWPKIYAMGDKSREAHKGWRNLIKSFNTAYKNSAEMCPVNGETATGAFWYKTILMSTQCSIDPGKVSGGDSQYLVKPDGFDTASDLISYAVVILAPESGKTEEWSLRFSSGGKISTITGLKPGLNFGNSAAAEGVQRMDLIKHVDGSSEIDSIAVGGRCIYDDCPDCTYNMNPHVAAFGDTSDGDCNERCDITTLIPTPENGDFECSDFGAYNESLCDFNDRSQEKWNCFGVGTYLEVLTNDYVLHDFNFKDRGLPEILAQYSWSSEMPQEYRWQWDCGSAKVSCKVVTDLDRCQAHPQSDYVLNAMQNFANYLNAFYESLQNVFQGLDFKSAKLLETYTDQSDDDEEVFSAGSWLALAGAVVGTFGGFAGTAAPFLGYRGIGGLLGVASTMTSAITSDQSDSRFTKWSEINDKLGDIYFKAQGGVSNYYTDILNKPPPNDPGWAYSSSSLPGLLKDGRFADWDSITSVDRDLDLIRHMVTAPLISMMWTQVEKIYLIRISDGTFYQGDPDDDDYKQFRPCDGLGNWFTDIDIENSKFCFENTAYLYVQWGDNEVHTDFFNVKGMDSLQNDVGMDGLGVAFSSMQTQKNAEDWFEFNPSNFWKDFIADPRGRQTLNPNELMQFNLPICDMDQMDLDKWWACGDRGSDQWQKCFLGTVNDYCLKGQKLNGHDWPWDGQLNNKDAGK